MRLSDVKGERTFEVIADIIDPIANIVEDEQVAKALGTKPKKGTTAQMFMQRMRAIVPLLLKEHRDDIVTILAAIGDTTPQEYLEETNLATLTGDIYELMTDEEFLAFLPSDAIDGGSGTSSVSTEE